MACLVVAITVACLQFPPAPAHAQVEVSASVKALATPTTTAMDAMAQPMGDAPPPVTLPGQILPQYQTEYSRVRSLNSREAGETLLILDVPSLSSQLGRPLLLSLKVELNQADLQSVHRKRLDSMVNEQSTVRSSKGTVADIDAGETDAAQVSSDESIDAAPIPENDASDSPQESTGIATEQSTAAYDLTTDPEELARRYATATGQSIEDTEADWLLTHWSKGPTLLLLRPYFQSFRSGERPAFRVLDRNEDGLLSPQEIEEARESLARCDVRT